jgi:exodeoxyribonuclease-1
VEKQIFGGFYSHADKALLAEFQRVDWRRRSEILDTLEDARLRQLGRRLVAFHAPELLSPEERTQFEAWLCERWSAPDTQETGWMTIDKAQRALNEVQASRELEGARAAELADFLAGYVSRLSASSMD